MRITSAPFLALLVASCSVSQPHLHQGAHAPAGWEPFCFPATIAYLPGTDRISPGTERIMPAIYDLHLRQTEWLVLFVSGGANPDDPAARALANRRAQSALQLLGRLGANPERVEVRVSYNGQIDRLDRDVDPQPSSDDARNPMYWAASVVTMIPPEQVARNEALQRENPRLVFC